MPKKRYGSISIDIDTLEFDLLRKNNSRINPNRTAELSELSYTRFLSRFLNICQKHDFKATFFIIGKHAQNPKIRTLIKKIASEGHEIANHSMNHMKHFSRLSTEDIEEEISAAEEVLSEITGNPILGFRAPGYVINQKILSILAERKYRYDSSLLPSIVYNGAKKIYKTLMGKKKHKAYFEVQNLRACLSPSSPFFEAKKSIGNFSQRESLLVEIPISVVPFLNIPFVSSLVSSLKFPLISFFYSLVKRDGAFLNYQFHDNEFADKDDMENLGIEKAAFYMTSKHMKKALDDRTSTFDRLISKINVDYSIIPLKDLATKIKEQ